MSWRLASGQVVRDRVRSHLHEGVDGVLTEALGRVTASEADEFLEVEVDMGRVVGVSTRVRTGTDEEEGNNIYYAQRPGRGGPSRFVRGRRPEPTRHVSVVLLRDRHDPRAYVLLTAYLGTLIGPEPWDRHATDASRAAWARQALIEDC